MNFGIVIGRIGGVDGVALETEKWIDILKELGHGVYIIAGEFEGGARKHKDYRAHFPMLSFFSPECTWEQDKAFFKPDSDPDPLIDSLNRCSEIVARLLKEWIKSKQIDILISQNASALPSHLSMGFGIKKTVEDTGIPTISHDHDFHWERGDRYRSPHEEINQMVEEAFPLRISNVHNVVINSYNQHRLKEKFGTEATLVPNVMDFSKPYASLTAKNRFFLEDLGVLEGDIPLFQVTRVVRRKGIKTAIKLIHLLGDPKIKLVVTGNHNDDEGAAYFSELVELIHDHNLINQVIFADKMITNKIELSDAYANARACTYFSTYEGFGNAFIECALAKKPIFVNNYEPVFWPDIGNKGFRLVMLENNDLQDEKVQEIKDIIYDPKLCKEIGEYNYGIAREHFSYDVLRRKLHSIVDSFKPNLI